MFPAFSIITNFSSESSPIKLFIPIEKLFIGSFKNLAFLAVGKSNASRYCITSGSFSVNLYSEYG
jgi:hypothetical protein